MKSICRAVRFITLPYYNRILLGEGGLVALNFFRTLFLHHSGLLIATDTVVSLLTMCLLYGFNDFTDRYHDAQNPKKDQHFVRELIDHPSLFIITHCALTISLVVFAYLFFGWAKPAIMIVLLLVNIGYSKLFKATPILDIIAVSVWGGLFIMLVDPVDADLAITAGLMTGIAHIYQILTDQDTDRATNIKTSAVAIPQFERWGIILLSIGLVLFLFRLHGAFFAVTGIFPIVINLLIIRTEIKWHLSRFYFALCWVLLII